MENPALSLIILMTRLSRRIGNCTNNQPRRKKGQRNGSLRQTSCLTADERDCTLRQADYLCARVCTHTLLSNTLTSETKNFLHTENVHKTAYWQFYLQAPQPKIPQCPALQPENSSPLTLAHYPFTTLPVTYPPALLSPEKPSAQSYTALNIEHGQIHLDLGINLLPPPLSRYCATHRSSSDQCPLELAFLRLHPGKEYDI